MYHFSAVATLALSFSASVSALVVPRAGPPASWEAHLLEPYDTYHTRYIALSCNTKHMTAFFDQCCHPLLATEKLETARPAQCIPAAGSADDDSDLPDCDEDSDDDVSTSISTPSTATPKASAPAATHPAAVNPAPKQAAPSPVPMPKVATQPQLVAAPPSTNSAATNTGGFATFFYQNGVAGACGTVHSDNDLIAAIDGQRYGNLGQRSSLCGKRVKITNTKNQKTVTVTIADACPTCNNGNSIDLSVAAFKDIATLDEGIVPISWAFL